MRTVSSRVNEKEFEALSEYANQTGESVSNLIRKVLINDAVYTYGFGNVPKDYRTNRHPVDMERKDG